MPDHEDHDEEKRDDRDRDHRADRLRRRRAQERWQAFWETDQTFRPLDDGSRERRYVLDMFPYPSGDLHMGHAEAFVMGDVVARYWKLKGYDVLHPIGWDSFGLPAENAAIKRNAHPAEWTYANIETQANSFKRYGLSLDWSRRLHTSDPGVLPLDPVAVPAVLRARSGLPQGAATSTGARTTRPCWPTSRSSRACASAAARWSPSGS